MSTVAHMDLSDDALRSQYTVGWIAPLPLELTAGLGLLEDHEIKQVHDDDVVYYVGRIGSHFVVMVVCSLTGTTPATTAITKMRRSFPNIKHVLVVGIAGGMPRYGSDLRKQIVLGDVVVSDPQHGSGGVTHYEFGVWDGENELTPRGHTLHPSDSLLNAVKMLRSMHDTKAGSKIPQYLQELRKGLNEESRRDYEDPGAKHDYLFADNYAHLNKGGFCDGYCDITQAKQRKDRGDGAQRQTDKPRIHYGNIGSANAVVKSSAKRNELQAKHNIICVEMEGAGVMNHFQGLVIRGISDYADSHKNDRWQCYAAATAAAYAKEVILHLPPGKKVSTGLLGSGNRSGNPPRESGRQRSTVHNSGNVFRNTNTGPGSQVNNNAAGTQYNMTSPGHPVGPPPSYE